MGSSGRQRTSPSLSSTGSKSPARRSYSARGNAPRMALEVGVDSVCADIGSLSVSDYAEEKRHAAEGEVARLTQCRMELSKELFLLREEYTTFCPKRTVALSASDISCATELPGMSS